MNYINLLTAEQFINRSISLCSQACTERFGNLKIGIAHRDKVRPRVMLNSPSMEISDEAGADDRRPNIALRANRRFDRIQELVLR